MLRRALAELIGTFTLVFAGCGAIIVEDQTHVLGHLGVALAFGLAIMTMVYAVGHISGAHLNPSVTLSFAVTRHLPWIEALWFWIAQFAGAIAAAAILRAIFGNVAKLGTTLPAGTNSQSFALEVVLTFFLMFVIISVATDTRAVGEAAAIAIGGTILMDAIFAGPISGASMNPARSLGPALVSGNFNSLWIYLTAPLVGSLAGAFAYQFIRGEKPQDATDPAAIQK